MRHLIYWIADNEESCFLVTVVILMIALGFLFLFDNIWLGGILILIWAFTVLAIDYCVKYKQDQARNINNNYK